MKNQMTEVADYVLSLMAENNEKQCIDHLPGTSEAFRKVYWSHIESVREMLKNEGLVDFIDERGYEIKLTPAGRSAARSRLANYRTENAQEYTTDKLLEKITALNCEVARLKATIRSLEFEIDALTRADA